MTGQINKLKYLLKECFCSILFTLLCLLYSSAGYTRTVESVDPARPVVEVKISGLDKELTEQVQEYLEIKKYAALPGLTEQRLQQLHSRATQNIKQAMRAWGYYNSQVQGQLQKNQQGQWRASYHIIPGQRVKVTQVDVKLGGEGKDNKEIQAICAQFAIHKGDFLDQEQYEDEKYRLLSRIGNRGYTDAQFIKKQLLIDPQSNSAQISLVIEPGPQYFFGEFRFHQTILNKNFVQKFASQIKPGTPLSQQDLLNLQQSLVKSGYFSLVDIKPEFTEVEDQKVPVDINLTPAKRHKLSFGLGYDTDIELNTTFRWQNRLLNSYGHYSDVLLKLSDKKSSLRGTWWMPVGEPGTDKIGITSKFETEKTDDTSRDTFDLEAAWVFKWQDWHSKLFTEYKFEHFEAGDQPETTARLFSIGGRMEGMFIENKSYPKKGWSAYAELRGAPQLIWSDTRYLRLHLKSRRLFPVGEKGRFILRGEIGLANVDNFELYPNSLRFFAGGDQSVRGYNWKSLGPKDKTGQVVGGKNVLSGSLEYNYQIQEKWLAAVFLDTGDAYNSRLDKLYYGAGFGARWLSPVGMIRTDLGWPINEDNKQTRLGSMVFYLGFEVNL